MFRMDAFLCRFRIGFASLKLFISNKETLSRINDASPTSVEIIGVLVIAHSTIVWGPPSTLEATIYKSNKLYRSFNFRGNHFKIIKRY